MPGEISIGIFLFGCFTGVASEAVSCMFDKKESKFRDRFFIVIPLFPIATVAYFLGW